MEHTSLILIGPLKSYCTAPWRIPTSEAMKKAVSSSNLPSKGVHNLNDSEIQIKLCNIVSAN